MWHLSLERFVGTGEEGGRHSSYMEYVHVPISYHHIIYVTMWLCGLVTLENKLLKTKN